MSTSNLFVGEASSAVNSPVISLSINSCGSKRRKRRSASTVGLVPGASTVVDINMSESSRGIAVNVTPPDDSDGVVMSRFNLTSPGVLPILLRIIPTDPSEINVFVRRNETPTSTDHDWFLTASNGTNNYSLYIPAEQTAYVSKLLVGVKPFTGRLSTYHSFIVLFNQFSLILTIHC